MKDSSEMVLASCGRAVMVQLEGPLGVWQNSLARLGSEAVCQAEPYSLRMLVQPQKEMPSRITEDH
jgi:hypothetical protein